MVGVLVVVQGSLGNVARDAKRRLASFHASSAWSTCLWLGKAGTVQTGDMTQNITLCRDINHLRDR